MKTITAKFKIVTPLFLGGAEPNNRAELRVPSIKGAMRFWYRAINPDYDKKIEYKEEDGYPAAWPAKWKEKDKRPTWEGYIFGDADHGQSAFSLRLEKFNSGDSVEWHPERYNPMDKDHPQKDKAPSYSNKNTWVLNGMRYFSYPFKMGKNRDGTWQNDRRYIPPSDEPFTVTVKIRKEDDKIIKAILASFWLLGHLGGLGSRSRRGFGTVALTELSCDGYSLPIANGEKNVNDWIEKFKDGKKIIKEDWFKGSGKADHSVLNDNCCLYLFEMGFPIDKENGKDKGGKQGKVQYTPWEEALNAAGVCMQQFRQRRNIFNDANKESDYFRVKAHLENHYPEATPSSGITPTVYLNDAPVRVAFGLPLTFQYGSLKHKKVNFKGEEKDFTPKTTFQGVSHDRSASPIHIRIIEIDGKCHPLFIRMDAPLLAKDERIKDSCAKKLMDIKPTNILNDFWKFMKEKQEPNGKEVSW